MRFCRQALKILPSRLSTARVCDATRHLPPYKEQLNQRRRGCAVPESITLEKFSKMVTTRSRSSNGRKKRASASKEKDGSGAKRQLSVIVPTYNETENLRPLCERLFAALGSEEIEGELTFVDDESEGTKESEKIVAKLKKEGFPVSILVRRRGAGRGLSSAVVLVRFPTLLLPTYSFSLLLGYQSGLFCFPCACALARSLENKVEVTSFFSFRISQPVRALTMPSTAHCCAWTQTSNTSPRPSLQLQSRFSLAQETLASGRATWREERWLDGPFFARSYRLVPRCWPCRSRRARTP